MGNYWKGVQPFRVFTLEVTTPFGHCNQTLYGYCRFEIVTFIVLYAWDTLSFIIRFLKSQLNGHLLHKMPLIFPAANDLCLILVLIAFLSSLFMLPISGSQPFWQQGTDFMEDYFSTDQGVGGGWFQDDSYELHFCAL